MAKNLKKFMGNGDVRNAIRRLGKQMAAELTDEEIFGSLEFRHYVTKIADFILRKHKLYSLQLHHDPRPSATVAYTNGKDIVLNTGNQLAQHPKLLEQRFKVNMGVLFHECGHKLFLDFDIHEKGMNSILGGNLYGKVNVPSGSDLEENLQKLEQALAAKYCKFIASVYGNVWNIVNDGHDEACMKACFPGFIADSIVAAGNVQIEQSTPLSELLARGAAPLSVYYSVMLQYAKFGICNVGEENAETDAIMQYFSRFEPVIDEALAEDDYMARWEHINTLVLLLWPILEKMIEENKQKQQNQNQKGSSGAGGTSSSSGGGQGTAPAQSDDEGDAGAGGSGSDSDAEDENDSDLSGASDDELADTAQGAADAASADNSAAPAPVGSGHAVSAQAVAAAQSGVSPDGDAGLAAMVDQIAQGKAAKGIQKDMDKAQLDAIRNVKRPLIHTGVPVTVNRQHPEDKAAYEELYQDVAPYVRNLIAEVQAFLREFNEEGVQRHRRYGPIIEATESYRPDGAFFARKKLPDDQPHMAMCILLDESGSMGGQKMHMSKKALVMLERFASGIGVPLMVAGHCVMRNVELNIYTDFVSTSPEKDRYTLGAIQSGGCNRDGLPIRLCAEMLAQRPEEIRLMVVISDGAPNDDGYGGEEARDDIRKIISEFRRKGVIIYGAAIDDDREVIQDLYEQGFLSITDLRALPKALVRLLKQNLV